MRVSEPTSIPRRNSFSKKTIFFYEYNITFKNRFPKDPLILSVDHTISVDPLSVHHHHHLTTTTTPPLSPSPSFSPLVLPASISQYDQKTALLLAAGGGHHESVDLLIKAGSDVTATDKVTL